MRCNSRASPFFLPAMDVGCTVGVGVGTKGITDGATANGVANLWTVTPSTTTK